MQTRPNHYPIIGRKAPRACSADGDTANPHAAITCPSCRARLEAKVAAELAEAARCYGAQEQRYHAAIAAHFSGILSGAEQLSAIAA